MLAVKDFAASLELLLCVCDGPVYQIAIYPQATHTSHPRSTFRVVCSFLLGGSECSPELLDSH